MWWIIIITVVAYIIYKIGKENKEDVQTGVTDYGGMKIKYEVLVNYLTQHPSSKITKLTSDRITISSPTATFDLDYVAGDLEINMRAFLPILGNIKKNWKYPDGYPQEKIITEIENYLDWKMDEYKELNNNDIGRYINHKN